MLIRKNISVISFMLARAVADLEFIFRGVKYL